MTGPLVDAAGRRARIWALHEQGLTPAAIAERMGIGRSTIDGALQTERKRRGIVLPERIRKPKPDAS